jgi:hypothetical protein
MVKRIKFYMDNIDRDKLWRAIYNYNFEKARKLIATGHRIRYSHIVEAIPYDGVEYYKKNKFFEEIIELINLNDAELTDLIFILIEKGSYDAFEAVLKLYQTQVKRIITHKVNEYSFLQKSAIAKDYNFAAKFIELGDDVHILDEDGETLLHLLCDGGNWMTKCYYPDIVKLFIDNGLDKDIKNKAGFTATDYAYLMGHNEHADYIEGYQPACQLDIKEPEYS